jgi:hypothetical protein
MSIKFFRGRGAKLRRDMRTRTLAAAALGLVLAVLAASAAIRLGQALPGFPAGPVRALHRVAASLEVLAMLGLAWLAWRRRSVVVAGALTVFLSILGIAAGQPPPPAAAAGNLLGGLALLAAFAWILGSVDRKELPYPRRIASWTVLLLLAQCLLGAWIAILAPRLWTPALIFHWLVGVALVCGALWLAFLTRSGTLKFMLVAVAALALASGYAAIIFDRPFGAALVHAVAGACFVAAAVFARARLA